MSPQQTELQDKAKEIVNKLDCKLESGEKEKIVGLGKELEVMKDVDEKKDILKANVRTLEQQKMGDSEKTLKEFLETDIKGLLVKKKAERDKKSDASKDYNAVQNFVKEIGQELSMICGNKKSDKVMGLQVYVNSLNDIIGKHATIPYTAKNYEDYKEGDQKRLFVDGYLGPHTYNALWLALFGEELPKVKSQNMGYIEEDGTVYLPGKDGKYNPYLVEKNKYSVENKGEKKELPVKFQKLNLFLEFYEIYKDAAIKIANTRNNLNSSWGKNEKQSILDRVNIMDGEISKLIEDINQGQVINDYDFLYNILFAKMTDIENNFETVIGNGDLNKIKGILKGFDEKKYKEQELEIMNITRRRLGDAILDSVGLEGGGNSEGVKTKLLEKILDRSDFSDINLMLQNPETFKSIVLGNTVLLAGQITKLGISKVDADKIIKEIIKSYKKIEITNTREKDQYKALIESQVKNDNDKKQLVDNRNSQAAQQNSGLLTATDWSDYLIKATDVMIKESTKNSTLILFQELMIEGKIKSMIDKKQDISKEKELLMMKDILGIGSWDVADDNLDYAVEAGQTIALAAVTMGVGAVAARVALSALKYGSKLPGIIKLTRYTNTAINSGSKMGKGLKLAKWGIKTSVEGAAFYEGSNISTNVILPDRKLFENVGDRKEIVKSIAFVGVLKGIGTALSKLNLGGNANTLINTNGLRIGAPKALVGKEVLKNFGKILVQGGILTGTSQGIEFVFSGFDKESWNPTWEEFIQACLLSRIMNDAGKIKNVAKVEMKKLKNGRIEMKALPPHTQQKALPPHPEQKALPPHNETPSKIKDLNAEIKKINIELKTLNENGMKMQADHLKIQRDRLMVERDRLVDGQKKTETKQEPFVENKNETPNRIKEIEVELKPINDRLIELNKTGEYNMPEGQKLREQKSKLTLERDRLIVDKKVSETKQETIVEKKNESKVVEGKNIEPALNSKKALLELEIKQEMNELKVAEQKLAKNRKNKILTKKLEEQVNLRKESIQRKQEMLDGMV